MTSLIENLFRQRTLLKHFTYREIASRYKGSYLGLVWTVLQPLVMLVIYSYVFTVIFKTKWGQLGAQHVSNMDFSMAIFGGLIVFQAFSESMYKASTLLVANSNFVKRVVFPLEVLPTAAVFGVFIINMVSVLILLVALITFRYPIGWNILLIPVVLLPVLFLTLGMSYIIAALGVFYRDLGQAIGLIMNVLFYLTPVFYPVNAVPKRFQMYMLFNPFTVIIDAFRNVTIYNKSPNWTEFGVVMIISLLVFAFGSFVFTRTKETFSDVI